MIEVNPERYQQVKAIFLEASGLEASARDAFIAERCAADDALAAEVRSLLKHSSDAPFMTAEDPDATRDGRPMSKDSTPTPRGFGRALEAGDRVGEYVVEAQIGAGAFGSVYRGVHPVIGKRVAIKVLSLHYSSDPDIVSRFVSEARAVNKIGHSHIIDIFAFGQLDDGRHYHVMELVDGPTLGDLLRERKRFDTVEALDLLTPVALALDAAAAAGIAHRDLKPANILVGTDDRGRRQPKLLDFGVAKLLDDDDPRLHETDTGATMGTPAYMSPEQCTGKRVDHRADIYAFGTVLFQMLTGRLPFEAPSAFLVMARHVGDPPPAPHELEPTIPEEVGRVVQWLLAKDPNDRPQTLAAAIERLEAICSGEPTIVPTIIPKVVPHVVPDLRPTRSVADETVSERPVPASPTPQVDVPAPPRFSKRAVAGGVAGAIAAGLMIALVFLQAAEPPSTAIRSAHAQVDATPELPTPIDTPPPIPTAPATIRVELRGLPADATVADAAGAVLRTGPGAVELARAEEGIDLTIAAPDYVEQTLHVVPDRARDFEVKLVARPAKRVARRRSPARPAAEPKAPRLDDLEPWGE